MMRLWVWATMPGFNAMLKTELRPSYACQGSLSELYMLQRGFTRLAYMVRQCSPMLERLGTLYVQYMRCIP